MPYEVQTSVFEGPFDLLLHLILREQVDLYEISLARIVDAYLVEIDKMERVDLEITTEFLLIAATLVELKCKRLLPDDTDFDLDDEFSLWEERDLLIARLLDCKTFKDAAHVLSDLFDNAALCVPRRAGLDERYFELAPDLLEGVDIDDVRAAYIRAMTPKLVPTVSIEHIHSVRVSVGEAVEELIDELRASFSVVIVTHSMQQAARVSQRTAFFHLGKMVEYGKTSEIFTNPREERTKDYITGRYG